MLTTPPYKRFFAALLLALYAFIAMPVQLWHHHSNTSALSNSAYEKDLSAETAKVFAAHAKGLSADGHCAVCSHKYSPLTDHTFTVFTSLIIYSGTTHATYQSRSVSAPAFCFQNRGPPSLL